MQWPARKSYEITIRLRRKRFFVERRASLAVRFQEATVGDLLSFTDQNAWDWAFRFVVERCRNLKEWESLALWDDRWRVFDLLRVPYFGKAETPQGGGKESIYAPFSSTLVWLSKEIACPPHVILDTYTPDQLKALAEGASWNANAQTKEGQARNEAIASRRKMDSVDGEEVKRKLAALDARLKSRSK